MSVGWSATVPAVRVSDGEPVGCAACSQYPRHPASGEPVPWSLSVGGMVCLLIGGRWDVLPVCEPVPWCRSDGVPQFQR